MVLNKVVQKPVQICTQLLFSHGRRLRFEVRTLKRQPCWGREPVRNFLNLNNLWNNLGYFVQNFTNSSISIIHWSASVATFLQSSQRFIRENCSNLFVQFIAGRLQVLFTRLPMQHSTYPAFTAHDVLNKFPVLRGASFSHAFMWHTTTISCTRWFQICRISRGRNWQYYFVLQTYCGVPHGTKQCHKVFLGTAGYYNIGFLATKYYEVPLRNTKYYWVLPGPTW